MILFGAVFVPAALAGTAGFLWLRSSLPSYDGTYAVHGLDSDVRVVRDSVAVPHIFAETENDAWFAVGFVHAQDRLWQLDFFRRAGQGRLAEVLGREALGFDRWTRGLGLRRLGAMVWPELPARTQGALQAYASGINAFLATRRGALPPEFLLLGYDPEPWEPVDSLVLSKLMAFQLSHNFRLELLRSALEQKLGPPAGELLPPLGLPPASRIATGEATRLALALPSELSGGGASNAWAVGGSRTVSGAPILAHDPHNPLGAPNLWYLVRIVSPSLALAGATAPGLPFVILGHNNMIAWAMTSTGTDLQDVYIERTDPLDSTRYLTSAGSLPFEVREETIAVAGEDPVRFSVRATQHGPVISDIEPGGAERGTLLALADVDLVPKDNSVAALDAIDHAKSWSEFLAAARLWRAPAQNLVYADRDGNIGRVAPAAAPLRLLGDGRRPVPGWTGEYDWRGTVPFDERPQLFNPASALLVSANDAIPTPDHARFLGDPLDEPYRAERITALLDTPGITPDRMAAIQQDVFAGDARTLLPLLLDAPASARSAPILHRLRQWNLRMDRDKLEPLIYAAWLRQLSRSLFADDLGDLFDRYWATRPTTLVRVLTRSTAWCDDRTTPQRTETCADALSASLEAALNELAEQQGADFERWRWGGVHKALFRHRIWSRVPLIGQFLGPTVETPGGDFTVNIGTADIADPSTPFAHTHGADFRAVYDLSDLASSRFMIAFGQSGNPLSPHYGDLADPWRDGRYLTLAGTQAEVAAMGLGTLMLTSGR